MGLFGDLVKGAMGGFPTVPDAPTAPFVNPEDAQMASIKGNRAALPELEGLGEDVNSFNLQQRAKALDSVPGFRDVQAGGTDVLTNLLSGKVAPDVASQVGRRANAHAFQGGYQGSGMADFQDARNYGLTSMDLQGRGLAAAPGWLQSLMGTNVPPEFNVQAGFMSPTQTLGAQQWNESNRYQRDWLQNQLESIPDPETAAIAADVGGIADVVGTAALAWAGGALGVAAGGAAGGAIGGQLGGAIGGGGGTGGAASQFGGTIGSLMGGGGSSSGSSIPTIPNWGQYITPPSFQQVSPYGGPSGGYNPGADIYSLGGYGYGGGY